MLREDEEQPSRHLPFCIFNFAFYRASTEAVASCLRDFASQPRLLIMAGSLFSPCEIRSRSCKPSLMSSSGQWQLCTLVPDLLYLEELKRHFAMLSSSARTTSRTDPWRRRGVSTDRLRVLPSSRRIRERRPYLHYWL